MSSKSTHKKRCIIQKLDFENCIITNIKTTTRRKKKLRARITREIEHSSDIPEDEKLINSTTASIQQAPEPTSPVLIKKRCKRESPVFFKMKKNSLGKDNEELSEGSTIEQVFSPPGSPVFKSFKKKKKNILFTPSQEFHVLKRTTSPYILSNQENSSSSSQSFFQIDDFTQESSQSVKISSVESVDVKNNNPCVYSIEAATSVSSQGPSQPYEKPNLYEKFENPKISKRNYKKNSLLGRLHKLKQKQASDKLLWQHQNRKKSSTSLKVSISSFWKENFNYILKCHSILPNSELTFLIIDSRWVPNIKNIKEGSMLQLHPPWQKLSVENAGITVLLNVICMDVLEEFKEHVAEKKTTYSVPANMFETNQNLFLNSLFSSCASGLLC